MEVKQRHIEKLIIESVRYCLGRMTYAVSECDEIVREYWKQLGKNTKRVIYRDIFDEIKNHSDRAMNNISAYHDSLNNGYSLLGCESDAFIWIDLLNWIEQWAEDRSLIEGSTPTVTSTLPETLKEPQEEMWIVTSSFEVRKSNYKPGKVFQSGRYFSTREDAQAWLDAICDSSR